MNSPTTTASATPLLLTPFPEPDVNVPAIYSINHSSFSRRSPSALNGNPPLDTLTSSYGSCPLSTPGEIHEWRPHYGAASGLVAFRDAHVVLDGLLISLDDDRTKSTVRRGYYHNWVGADLIRMLVASELAIRTSKGALRIPGGLRSLRVADAVRVTTSRGLTTAKAAQAANSAQHGLWEWYSYPSKFRQSAYCDSDDTVAGLDAVPIEYHTDYPLAAFNRHHSTSYFHWLVETLPYIARLREFELEEMGPKWASTRYLIYDTPFARASLLQLGIPADHVITQDPCVLHSAKFVFAPIHAGSSGTARRDLSREHYLAVRQAAMPTQLPAVPTAMVEAGTGSCSPAVLLLRGRNDGLYLTNMEEVREVLRDELLPTSHHPVAAIEIRTLPFSEQAAVFASASLVVGVEGSGLANVVFMKEGSVAVSITPSRARGDCGETCYWHISAAMGVRFWSFLLPETGWEDEEVSVPMERWKAFVADLGREMGCGGGGRLKDEV